MTDQHLIASSVWTGEPDKGHVYHLSDISEADRIRQYGVAEIDIPALEKAKSKKREVRPNVVEYTVGGKRINLLADGRLINLSAAEGHPAMVMDMSFANQALGAEYVVKNHKKLKNQVYVIPEYIDEKIAAIKLKSMGISIDRLTAEQKKYLSS